MSFADGTGKKKQRIYDSVKELVSKNIHFPETINDALPQERVLVSYQIDALGNFHITNVEASKPQLEEYVYNKFNNLKLDPSNQKLDGQLLIVFKKDK